MSQDCKIPINTKLPLQVPYRTGSYLIYDYDPDQKPAEPKSDCPPPCPDHFREGLELLGLRASGSRQVDADPYGKILKKVAANVPPGGKLYAVDLRQESHLFFDGLAVSWYADKDWSNVGQSLDWVLNDEACRIDMSRGKTVQIFCKQNNPDGSVSPAGYSDLPVKSALSEEEVVCHIAPKLPCPVIYERIAVTDHCMPTMDAAKAFVELVWNLKPEENWIHFHCHGGDGRTTTFLAMYDMFCWAKSGKQPFPSLDCFVQRQMKIFCYNLSAPKSPCSAEPSDWKCGLAVARWGWLEAWHSWLAHGGLLNGKRFEYKEPAR